MISIDLPPSVIDRIAAQVAEMLGATSNEPEPWIDTDAAAEHLACTRRRIYDLATAGRIPYMRDGKRLLFRRSELDSSLGAMG